MARTETAQAITLTTCDTPEDVIEHLLTAGTPRPSLHPGVGIPDLGWVAPFRWNGCNDTLAGGVDAKGRPISVAIHHNADGYDSPSAGFASDTPRGGSTEFVFEPIEFPVILFPPFSIVKHPEHTPGPTAAAHWPQAVAEGDGFRPVCRCGWRGPAVWDVWHVAEKVSVAHVDEAVIEDATPITPAGPAPLTHRDAVDGMSP